MATCFALIATDRWGEDYVAEEVYLSKDAADARMKALNDSDKRIDGSDLGAPDYFYTVAELPLYK